MKTITTLLSAALLYSICCVGQTNTFPSTGPAGIGTTSPNASSLLEVRSTSKGILIPRMTQTQRNAIKSPATGLLIFQTDRTAGFYYYTGTAWTAVSKTSKAWALTGNANTTSANFIGTTDAHPLTFKVNNQKSAYIDYTSPYNTIFGYQGLNASSGAANSAFGYQALYIDTSGSYNTATGFQALYSTSLGSFNTATGASALFYNSTGNYNTANGYDALYNNIDGYSNTASGYFALYANSYGHGNAGFGTNAVNSNTTGIYNSGFGYASLYSNSTGNYNTAGGAAALYNNNGSYNTAVGFEALRLNNESYNTAFGYQALRNTTASEYNLAVGYNAGYSLNNGYNNVFLGANTDVNGIGYYNVIAIGQGTICTAVSQVTIGNPATNSYRAYATWSNISDGRFKKNIKEDVPGLKFINKLRPVTYTLDATSIDAFVHKNVSETNRKGNDAASLQSKALKEKEQFKITGFIAQEVEKTAKEVGYDFSGVDAPKNSNDLYALRYADFVVPLVKAVQELSLENDSLKKKNNELETRLSTLESVVFAGQSPASSQYTELKGSARLDQNTPNPFSGTTTIGYYLPSNRGTAYINFYSASGTILKSIKLNSGGSGSINVKAIELPAGIYQYALVIDGKVIDTKQMARAK